MVPVQIKNSLSRAGHTDATCSGTLPEHARGPRRGHQQRQNRRIVLTIASGVGEEVPHSLQANEAISESPQSKQN